VFSVEGFFLLFLLLGEILWPSTMIKS
jgi:hypothetical protein